MDDPVFMQMPKPEADLMEYEPDLFLAEVSSLVFPQINQFVQVSTGAKLKNYEDGISSLCVCGVCGK